MDKKWLVIGICGVTCGGKTTLARKCKKFLPNARVISQDDYFLPKDSTKHTIIPELNHINWEILSSLDMDRLYQDIKKITSTDYENQIVISTRRETFDEPTTEIPVTLEDMQVLRFRLSHFNILIVEGFSLFNYEPVEKLCDLKIYVLLSRETCYARRSGRVYDPADVPGYFDKIVWPEHLQQLEEVQQKCRNVVYLYENNLNPLGTIFKHLLLLSSRFQ